MPGMKKKTAAPKPTATKKATPSPKPTATKKPTLDDFLLKGKRPPLAPGQKKLPSDSDVVLKKYKKK